MHVRVRLGRLGIVISPFASSGHCQPQGRVASRTHVLIYVLGGVAANVAAAAAFGLLALADQPANSALLVLAVINALGVINLAPSYAPTSGRPLDGLLALRLLQRRPQPAPRAPQPGGLNRRIPARELALGLPVTVLVVVLMQDSPVTHAAIYALALNALLSELGATRRTASQRNV